MRYLIFGLMAFPAFAWAQPATYLGFNLAPLLSRGWEASVERQVSRIAAIQLGVGYRRDGGESHVLAALDRFTFVRNRGGFFSAGVRFTEPGPYEHPFIGTDAFLLHYVDWVRTAQGEIAIYKGWKWGIGLTVGFVAHLGMRFQLEAAARLSFVPPRSSGEPLQYYLPGVGYTTQGLNIVGTRGGHVQPIISLKYNLFPDRRTLLRRSRE